MSSLAFLTTTRCTVRSSLDACNVSATSLVHDGLFLCNMDWIRLIDVLLDDIALDLWLLHAVNNVPGAVLHYRLRQRQNGRGQSS